MTIFHIWLSACLTIMICVLYLMHYMLALTNLRTSRTVMLQLDKAIKQLKAHKYKTFHTFDHVLFPQKKV